MKFYSVLTLLAALQSLASLDICKYNHNGWSFCLLLLLVPHGSKGPNTNNEDWETNCYSLYDVV